MAEQITKSELIKMLTEDLENGIHRYYDPKFPDRMTIMKKYGVSRVEVADWFKIPELKGKRVMTSKGGSNRKFQIVDDEVTTDNQVIDPEPVTQQPSVFSTVNDIV